MFLIQEFASNLNLWDESDDVATVHRRVFKCRGQVLEPAGVGDGAPIPYKV